jgi:2-hydroxychromene-2-carboxylate isomerase
MVTAMSRNDACPGCLNMGRQDFVKPVPPCDKPGGRFDKRVAVQRHAGDTPRPIVNGTAYGARALAKLEFFYDCSSPWTYLAFSRIEALVERTKAEMVWRPILVGGVFNAVNESVYEARANPHPVKSRYYDKDLKDWARHCGIEIGRPPVFPVRSVDAMRAAVVASDKGRLPEFSWATFRAYWGELKDISQPDVLDEICRAVGLDWEEVSSLIKTDDVKGRLRANTEELIARGGFGSPTMFVNDTDMYFGNDRLPLVEAALSNG